MTKVISVWKNIVLMWQVGATGVHQVNAGQVIFFSDSLRTQMLLYRDGVIGTAFNRCVIGDNNALLPAHTANSCDNAAGVYHIFTVHFMTSQLRQLQER